MYFLFFILHGWRKRSAVQPQTICSEIPLHKAFAILLSFTIALLVGRKALKVSENTSILVGGGTCICGGTAIATLSRIVKAKEEEIAFAMAAIFLFAGYVG